MILQALVKYYEDLERQEKLPNMNNTKEKREGIIKSRKIIFIA